MHCYRKPGREIHLVPTPPAQVSGADILTNGGEALQVYRRGWGRGRPAGGVTLCFDDTWSPVGESVDRSRIMWAILLLRRKKCGF